MNAGGRAALSPLGRLQRRVFSWSATPEPSRVCAVFIYAMHSSNIPAHAGITTGALLLPEATLFRGSGSAHVLTTHLSKLNAQTSKNARAARRARGLCARRPAGHAARTADSTDTFVVVCQTEQRHGLSTRTARSLRARLDSADKCVTPVSVW